MAPNGVGRVVRSVRLAALRRDALGLTDGELLEAFVRRHDADAFEGLVRRHGAMVLGVCRRVLRNDADAEDAFQATFLLLLRKAGSIRTPSAVSNWLYGVAHTTALKAKAMLHKRRAHEREAGMLPRHQACEEVWQAVQTLLDAELAALPDKYRVPIVLCELEGQTIRQTALQLGWPQGTVATRLARGRALLAKRLAKHGLTVSAGALSAALAHGTAAAKLPAPLLHATTLLAAGHGAAGFVSAKVVALSQGVIQAMLLTKLKSCALGIVVLAVLGTGVGSFGHGLFGEQGLLAQEALPQGKVLAQGDSPAKLQAEIERLRAELKKTRLELERATYQIEVLKAQAALAEADAQLARLKAQEAVDPKVAKTPPVPVPSVPPVPNIPPANPKNADAAANAAAISPDGRTIVVADGTTIVLRDTETGQIRFKAVGHKAVVTGLAFSPDGKLIVSGSKDKTVCTWDPGTGKQLRQLIVPGAIVGVSFSPDARTLVIVESDGTQRMFDTATGKELRVVAPPKGANP